MMTIAPTHLRGVPHNAVATATATATKITTATKTTAPTADSPLSFAFAVLLRAARAACAFIRAAIANAASLFGSTTTSASTFATSLSTSETTSSPIRSLSTSAVRSTRGGSHAAPPRANPADERPITSFFATHHVLARRAATEATQMIPHHHPTASTTPRLSIMEAMHSVTIPDEDDDHDDAPHERVLVEEPDVLPVFEDFLLPPTLDRLNAVGRAQQLAIFARSRGLQRTIAQRRMYIASLERQGSTEPTLGGPPSAYDMYFCGCSWCPNGTAAYPLCAAITIRRTIRLGTRATHSVAGAVSRRENMCGYRDATAVFDGRTRD